TLFFGSGENDDRQRFGARIILDAFQDFQASQLWKFEVEQDQTRRMVKVAVLKASRAEKKFKRFFSIPYGKNVVGQMLAPQCVQGEFEIVGIVFDEKDVNFAFGIHPVSPDIAIALLAFAGFVLPKVK